MHAIEIDLMTPIDPERSPKVQSPALNHIGLWVDNLDNAVKSLTSKGIIFTPGGIRKGASAIFILKLYCLHYICIFIGAIQGGYDVSFVHPRSATGVLLELVQAPPEVIEAYSY